MLIICPWPTILINMSDLLINKDFSLFICGDDELINKDGDGELVAELIKIDPMQDLKRKEKMESKIIFLFIL